MSLAPFKSECPHGSFDALVRVNGMWASACSQCGQLITSDDTITWTFRDAKFFGEKVAKCDCGAAKVKTTHSHWCSTNKK